jgi:hypothetical protein
MCFYIIQSLDKTVQNALNYIFFFFLLLNFGKRQNQVDPSKKLIMNIETSDENNDELHTGGIGRNISSEDSPFRIIGKL